MTYKEALAAFGLPADPRFRDDLRALCVQRFNLGIAANAPLVCHLAGLPIARRWGQPAHSGDGNYFAFDLDPNRTHSH